MGSAARIVGNSHIGMPTWTWDLAMLRGHESPHDLLSNSIKTRATILNPLKSYFLSPAPTLVWLRRVCLGTDSLPNTLNLGLQL